MIRRIIKIFFSLLIFAGLAVAFFYWQSEIISVSDVVIEKAGEVVLDAKNFFSPPCVEPIYYSLGTIDQKFGLTDTVLIKTLDEAAQIWNKPVGQQLFAYKEDGAVKINLIYDYRQEATDKLKKLGIVVTNDQKSYDDLKIRYDELNRQYGIQKAALDSAIASLTAAQASYEAEVDKYNAQGGAPKVIYDRLMATKASLDTEVTRVNSMTDRLNQLGGNINAEAVALNQLIDQLNLTVTKYNSIGASTGEEFREGQYVRDGQGERIDIYQFNDHNQLVRLIAHEFGHALGLNHTSSSKDIMYYLNDSENLSLSATDIATVKTFCKIPQ